MRFRILIALLPLLLSACVTVGPDYTPPVVTTPDAWHSEAVDGLSAGEASLETWW